MMERTVLERLVLRKTLDALAPHEQLLESMLSGPQSEDLPSEVLEGLSGEDAEVVKSFHESIRVRTKNVCAKVAPQLSDRIDSVCALLHVSKRAFLEAAFLDALAKAEKIMEEEGLYESLADRSSVVEEAAV